MLLEFAPDYDPGCRSSVPEIVCTATPELLRAVEAVEQELRRLVRTEPAIARVRDIASTEVFPIEARWLDTPLVHKRFCAGLLWFQHPPMAPAPEVPERIRPLFCELDVALAAPMDACAGDDFLANFDDVDFAWAMSEQLIFGGVPQLYKIEMDYDLLRKRFFSGAGRKSMLDLLSSSGYQFPNLTKADLVWIAMRRNRPRSAKDLEAALCNALPLYVHALKDGLAYKTHPAEKHSKPISVKTVKHWWTKYRNPFASSALVACTAFGSARPGFGIRQSVFGSEIGSTSCDALRHDGSARRRGRRD